MLSIFSNSYTTGLHFLKSRSNLLRIGDVHIAKSAGDVVGADYAGSHWLASFLTHALLTREKLFATTI